jgi:hypothetical protein
MSRGQFFKAKLAPTEKLAPTQVLKNWPQNSRKVSRFVFLKLRTVHVHSTTLAYFKSI